MTMVLDLTEEPYSTDNEEPRWTGGANSGQTTILYVLFSIKVFGWSSTEKYFEQKVDGEPEK